MPDGSVQKRDRGILFSPKGELPNPIPFARLFAPYLVNGQDTIAPLGQVEEYTAVGGLITYPPEGATLSIANQLDSAGFRWFRGNTYPPNLKVAYNDSFFTNKTIDVSVEITLLTRTTSAITGDTQPILDITIPGERMGFAVRTNTETFVRILLSGSFGSSIDFPGVVIPMNTPTTLRWRISPGGVVSFFCNNRLIHVLISSLVRTQDWSHISTLNGQLSAPFITSMRIRNFVIAGTPS